MKHKAIINIDNHIEHIELTGVEVLTINKILSKRRYKNKVKESKQNIAAKHSKNLISAKNYLKKD